MSTKVSLENTLGFAIVSWIVVGIGVLFQQQSLKEVALWAAISFTILLALLLLVRNQPRPLFRLTIYIAVIILLAVPSIAFLTWLQSYGVNLTLPIVGLTAIYIIGIWIQRRRHGTQPGDALSDDQYGDVI